MQKLIRPDAVVPEMEGGGSTWWYVCGACHGAIDYKDPYCRHCGTPQNWLKFSNTVVLSDTDTTMVSVEDVLETIRDMATNEGHVFVARDLLERLKNRLMK